MKPKYLVYNSTNWYDGASECDTLEEAEQDFERQLKRLGYDRMDGPTDEYYVAIAKVVKCTSAKDIQRSVKVKKDV